LRFRSKIGGALLGASLLVFLLGSLNTLRVAAEGRYVMAVVLGFPVVLLAWVLAATHYTITSTDLRIRCAFHLSIIPLAAIRRLSATRNARSSPALSPDRIVVEHEGGQVMVSPRDRAGFVHAIRQHQPGVEIRDL
jgi:hypothetical protein